MFESAEIAVKRSFQLEKKESRRKTPAGLGFAQVNYGNLFVRDKWTLFAIARELDCTIEDILEPKDSARVGPRWNELISASERILDTVRSLPAHARHLVMARGIGHSWRRIQRDNPGRIFFSLRDDYQQGIEGIIHSVPEAIVYLASFDNFTIVSR